MAIFVFSVLMSSTVYCFQNRVGTIVNAELSSHGATHTFGTAAGVLGCK